MEIIDADISVALVRRIILIEKNRPPSDQHDSTENERRTVTPRQPRSFLTRTNLEILSDGEIIQRFRLNREAILHLYSEIGSDLEPLTARTRAVPGIAKLLSVLHFLATGSFQAVTSVITGISQPTFSRYLLEVLKAICKVAKKYIHFPCTRIDWDLLKVSFYRIAGMPNVLGAVDCTHIPIRPPRHGEEQYRNRKHFHSLNVQMVSDSQYKIMSVKSGFPGSCHDSYILKQSTLFQKFEDGHMPEGWLLGDSGYGCRSWLLTPVLNPKINAEEKYNESHRSTRSVIERTFGLLKARFRCLDKSGGVLQYSPLKVTYIILACCVLHNIALSHGLTHIGDVGINHEEQVSNASSNENTDNGRHVRNQLISSHFM